MANQPRDDKGRFCKKQPDSYSLWMIIVMLTILASLIIAGIYSGERYRTFETGNKTGYSIGYSEGFQNGFQNGKVLQETLDNGYSLFRIDVYQDRYYRQYCNATACKTFDKEYNVLWEFRVPNYTSYHLITGDSHCP